MVDLTYRKHSVGQSAYHFVWKPKYNVNVFRHTWCKQVCEDAIKQAASNHKIQIYELRVMPDHIHVFAEVPPSMNVSKALQLLKGVSAREFFKKCTGWKAFFANNGTRKPSLWSPGKFFRSVGSVTADVIENYIKNSQDKWDFGYLDKTQTTLSTY